MTTLTSMILGLEANSVPGLIDGETAKFYAHLFALPNSDFRNTTELAQALLDANENGAEWNRFSITRVLPRADKNLLSKVLYGFRLY